MVNNQIELFCLCCVLSEIYKIVDLLLVNGGSQLEYIYVEVGLIIYV